MARAPLSTHHVDLDSPPAHGGRPIAGVLSLLERPVAVRAGALGLALLVTGVSHAQNVTIGSDRILRLDGQPFFPVGLLELGIDLYPQDWNQRIRDCGANIVWDTGVAYRDSTPSCAAVRDSSLAAGYYVLAGSPDTWNWDDPITPELEVAQPMYDPDSLAALNGCFPNWALHVGYVNRDEPEWVIPRGVVGDVDSAHVHATYTQLQAADPSKVVAMNFGNAHLSADLEQWKSDVSGYLPATDIVFSANYPYPPGPGTCGPYNVFGPDCSMDRLWWAADIYRNELAPSKPLWLIVQSHKGIPLKESRWEAAQAIIHGATGLLWAGWTWFHALGDGMANWDVTRQVISEYAALHDVLVQPDVSSIVSLEQNVHVLGKVDPGNEYVVFAASTNAFSGEATIRFGHVWGGWVEVVNEHRWIAIEGMQFGDTFDGYESHIYRVGAGAQPPVDAPVVADGPAPTLSLSVFPNPATSSSVTARLTAPAIEGAIVSVHDVLGRRIAQADVAPSAPHAASVTWSRRDTAGHSVPPGVYFLRARTAAGAETTARVVIR
jgi:hypothetical protein